MSEIVAVDIGGTHIRFAIASLDGLAVTLGETTTFATRDYSGIDAAWRAYAVRQSAPLPSAAAIAVAAPYPVYGDLLRFTNSDWTIDRERLHEQIGVAPILFLNDFEAVAEAVAAAPGSDFTHLAGHDFDLRDLSMISVVGPGTGLGVAQLQFRHDGAQVKATEGGHIGFAPATPLDDAVVAALRLEFGRASAERVVSGAGLRVIYRVMTGADSALDDPALWRSAITGNDRSAADALDQFCRCLGLVAGDLALAHGAGGVVIAGGLGARLAGVLPHSSFGAAFADKGRFAEHMAAITVKIITHPQPGLFGAAAAFARERPT